MERNLAIPLIGIYPMEISKQVPMTYVQRYSLHRFTRETLG